MKLHLAVMLALAPSAWADNSQCVALPVAATLQPAALPAKLAPAPMPAEPEGTAADKMKAYGVPEMTPDTIANFPALAPIVAGGARIFIMGHAGGVPNMVMVKGNQFQAVAPMTDPNYLCRGIIQDSHGSNITKEEEAKIPGLVPPPGKEVLDLRQPPAAIQAIAKASYGTFGTSPTAPVVWVVIDPLCVHSQQAINDLLPYAKRGVIRLNILPVAVISKESEPEARVLLSEQPDHMMERWFTPGILQASYDASSADKLAANARFFAGLQTQGVPYLLWSNKGVAQSASGLDTTEVPGFIAGLGR